MLTLYLVLTICAGVIEDTIFTFDEFYAETQAKHLRELLGVQELDDEDDALIRDDENDVLLLKHEITFGHLGNLLYKEAQSTADIPTTGGRATHHTFKAGGNILAAARALNAANFGLKTAEDSYIREKLNKAHDEIQSALKELDS